MITKQPDQITILMKTYDRLLNYFGISCLVLIIIFNANLLFFSSCKEHNDAMSAFNYLVDAKNDTTTPLTTEEVKLFADSAVKIAQTTNSKYSAQSRPKSNLGSTNIISFAIINIALLSGLLGVMWLKKEMLRTEREAENKTFNIELKTRKQIAEDFSPLKEQLDNLQDFMCQNCNFLNLNHFPQEDNGVKTKELRKIINNTLCAYRNFTKCDK